MKDTKEQLVRKKETLKVQKIRKRTKLKEKGITLIALVVTIIILLILAGVTLNMALSDNGLFKKAKEAVDKYEKTSEDEQKEIAMLEATMNVENTDFQGVTIPAGMAPTKIEGESTIKEGLVAIDINGNEWVWIEVPKTEMPKELNFVNKIGYSTGDDDVCEQIETALKEYAKPYTEVGNPAYNLEWKDEWYAAIDSQNTIITSAIASDEQKELNNGCGLTLSEYTETYQKMLKSIYLNGGFWIGRYEAGIKGSIKTDEDSTYTPDEPTLGDDTSREGICQKDAIPYGLFCRGAQSVASRMTPNEDYTSSLMFGLQWDLVCKFLETNSNLDVKDISSDSSSWGNFAGRRIDISSDHAWGFLEGDTMWRALEKGTKVENHVLTTGSSDDTKILNIYDFAGNLNEWTLEHCSKSENAGIACGYRGGFMIVGYSSIAAAGRDSGYVYSRR